jgi:hypothetical protein
MEVHEITTKPEFEGTVTHADEGTPDRADTETT